MNISSWTRLPDQSYERPIGTLEAAFYWAEVFARTTDINRCTQIQVVAGNLDEIIGLPNVVRAWTNVKMRFPLLGSRLHERDKDVFLNVSKDRLLTYQPNEILFHGVSSFSEAVHFLDTMLETEQLSNDLLVRIVIARDQSRTDSFYFLFTIAHVIADGLSCITIIRTFMNELCGISSHQSTWEERLALSVPSEQLNPAARMNKARQRWRCAIAATLASRIQARFKGGHGLPQKVSEKTRFTPSRSAHRSITLPPKISSRIIHTCDKKGITFGNAYPIIGQVAAARVLLRHYLQGEIDEDEWDFRKKEPMYSFGPVNLRRFLDPEWLEAGGLDHVCVAISSYCYSISFLPLGRGAELRPGMKLPEVGDLLTRERFFYRAKLVQKQAKELLMNPLFIEIGDSLVAQQRRVESARERALQWKAGTGSPSDRIMTPMERALGFVECNGGSSIGNIDKLLPWEYPVTSQESPIKVKLQLGQAISRLRCHPGELYLGAVTMHEQFTAFVHFDSNVFDEAFTDEWLKEVEMALEFYLGEENI